MYNIFLNYNDTPRYIQWTIPFLLYQSRRKNTWVYKGLNMYTQLPSSLISQKLPKYKGRWQSRRQSSCWPIHEVSCASLLISVLCLFSVIRFYQEYTEPDENSSSSQTSLRRDANPLHPRHSSSSTSEDDNVVLPLGENILSQNLGIPIVVVITKVSFRSISSIPFCMSKVKVKGQGQIENLFLEHHFHILCSIVISFGTSVHHN